jgi:NADH-quinone oxidoreductase subunit N
VDYSTILPKIEDIIGSLGAFFPELVLVAMVVLLTLVELVGGRYKRHLVRTVAFAGSILFLVGVWHQWSLVGESGQFLFVRMLFVDRFAVFFKALIGIGVFFAYFMTYFYRKEAVLRVAGEPAALVAGVALGASLLAMSAHWLMVYLSIETISICSYLLTAFGFDKKSSEAGMKYAIFGAAASGVMLYGLSLLYGFTGSLDFYAADYPVLLLEIPALPLSLAMLLVLGGLLFKMAAVPFHVWAPDVYEAAPTPVVGFFAVVPKLAGLAFLWKFVFVAHLFGEGAFPWQMVLAVVAIASMLLGNLGALRQSSPKRMLAYSSIAQAGFLLTGVVAFSEFGLSATLFYAAVYAVMTLSAFLLIQMAEVRYRLHTMEAMRGWGLRLPLFGSLILLTMISLAGIPPMAGFTAKLFVFSALWETWSQGGQGFFLGLFVVGLLNTVLSIFYYLKIPYLLFFKEMPKEDSVQSGPQVENYFALALVVVLLWWFFQPGWLMSIINSINFAL